MRAFSFLILVFLQLAYLNPAFSEDLEESADSATLANQAAKMAKDAKERSEKNYKTYTDKANQFDQLAREAAKKAIILRAAGQEAEAQGFEAQAKTYIQARDLAKENAQEEKEQAEALEEAEEDEIEARNAQETESSTSIDAGVEHVAKTLTGPVGGNVQVDNPNSDGVHFVCDGGKCRAVDGNSAMENAYTKWNNADPGDTYAVRSVNEIVDKMKTVPEGDPVTISGHGDPGGLTLDSDTLTTLQPGTPEFDQLANALKGHPVTFESCSLANVQGFCSALAQQTGSSVTAYDQTMYSGTTGFYAKDPNTSEHTWQPAGSQLMPGEIVQNSMETQNPNPIPNQFFVQQIPNQDFVYTPGNIASGFGGSGTVTGPFIVASILNAVSSNLAFSQTPSQTFSSNQNVPTVSLATNPNGAFIKPNYPLASQTGHIDYSDPVTVFQNTRKSAAPLSPLIATVKANQVSTNSTSQMKRPRGNLTKKSVKRTSGTLGQAIAEMDNSKDVLSGLLK